MVVVGTWRHHSDKGVKCPAREGRAAFTLFVLAFFLWKAAYRLCSAVCFCQNGCRELFIAFWGARYALGTQTQFWVGSGVPVP